ncbi:MAG: Nramp family divalent metal transporter [Coriobacteriia bacterium]|nr:Nramp family divalent metal transporter [Coriobacteriia bacterium]
MAATSNSTRRRTGIIATLAIIGPGIITAMAGNDAGGVTTYSVAGASYGYATLWMILVMAFALAVVQEMAVRMGSVTGKGLASLIRERFGVRTTLLAMLVLLVSNTATSVAEFAGIAAALELLGVSKYLSVPACALLVWLVVVRGDFSRVEKLLLGLSAVFVLYPIAAFMAKPDWGEVIHATFVPQFVPEVGFIAIVIAAIGTTIAPWMQFFAQSNVVDKGLGVEDLPSQRLDTYVGVAAACIVAWFIIIVTGTVLYPAGIEITSAEQAAAALAPVAGQYAGLLFAVGLFGASLLAASVLPLTSAYAITEAFGWERGIDHTWSQAPAFNAIYTFVIFAGAAIVLLPNAPLITLMVLSQTLGGILLPFLLIFMVRLINDRRIMGVHVNSRLQNIFAYGTIVTVIALTVMLFGMQIGKAVGLL